MPSNNTYVINEEPRLPTKVKRAINDYVVRLELKASRVASDMEAFDKVEQQFAELIQIVREKRPDRLEVLTSNMRRPVEAYRVAPRYRTFADLDITRPDALETVNLVALHSPHVSPFRDGWVHIPPMVAEVAHISHANTPDHLIPQTEYKGLKFFLSKVKCFDETHGCHWYDPEWGEDEIYCGAVAVDENGNTTAGGLFKVGDFDDGDLVSYNHPGKQLQYFNIHEGGDSFPKIYTMAISLVEHDWGDLPEWFNKFLNTVREEVTEYLTALLGATIGSPLGPLGALFGTAIGWAVGKALALVKGWLGDEVLGTAIVKATINSYSGNWAGSGTALSNLYTRDFRGDCSHYRIYWRVQLVS